MTAGSAIDTLASGLRAWSRLGVREKAEACYIAALALVAEAAVRAISLPRLTKMLGISLGDGARDPFPAKRRWVDRKMEPIEVDARARAVDRIYRAWPRRDSCLRRALVLGYRIRAASPVLMIGVAKEDGLTRAHAWIEVGGKVVGDDSGDYAPLRSHKTAG
jgi:transglutaminase superfamily protein